MRGIQGSLQGRRNAGLRSCYPCTPVYKVYGMCKPDSLLDLKLASYSLAALPLATPEAGIPSNQWSTVFVFRKRVEEYSKLWWSN